jgi:two-component system OmpR family response regulator
MPRASAEKTGVCYLLYMGIHILIVDDDQDIIEALATQLAEDGFHVTWANDADSFKEMVFGQKTHLIILDIMLGNDNGPEIYRTLLADGLSQAIPVIFLSALVTDAEMSEAQPGRTYAMHSKPFHYNELLRDIRCLTTPDQLMN